MISVRYKGDLGNKLYQYSLARILASRKQYYLNVRPISGFPGTQVTRYGRYVTSDVLVLGGNGHQHLINLEAAVSHSGSVHLDGYFQVFDYYREFYHLIRNNWLRVDGRLERQHRHDVVVHIRRGDYAGHRQREVPAEFYHAAIQQLTFRHLHIVSDGDFRNDPYFRQFDVYRPKPHIGGDRMDDFRMLMSFRRIVISPSSYSWWAAFLSNAEVVLMPGSRWKGMWYRVAEDRYYVPDGRYQVVGK